MNVGIIYKAISPSGKCYIGQTIKRLSKRRGIHLSNAYNKNYIGYNTKFSNAIRKYEDNLKWKILYDNVPLCYLNDMEVITIKWYNSYKNGYNSTIGGEGSIGYKHTDETKKKMSQSGKGKKLSEEHKKKLSLSGKGRKLSDKTKRKISQSNKGRKHSEKHKKRISQSHKGKKLSEEHKKKLSLSHKNKKLSYGEKNPRAKLTWNKVNEIRIKYIPYKYTALMLAKEYNVGILTIQRIINNYAWVK